MENFLMDNLYTVVDFVVLVLFLIISLTCARKGIYGTVAPVIIIVASLAVGITFSAMLTQPVFEKVWPGVEERTNAKFDSQIEALKEEKLTPEQSFVESFNILLESLNLDSKQIKSSLDSYEDSAVEAARHALLQKTATVTVKIVHLILFGFITAIMLLLSTLAKNLLEKVANFSIVGWANRLLGFLFGVAICLVITWLVLRVCSFLHVTVVQDYIDNSILIHWVTKNVGNLLSDRGVLDIVQNTINTGKDVLDNAADQVTIPDNVIDTVTDVVENVVK